MTVAELEARRQELIVQLSDENFDGDVDAVVSEADEIRSQIEAHNDRVARANEARRRILDAAPARAEVLGADATSTPTVAASEKRVGNNIVSEFLDSDGIKEIRTSNAPLSPNSRIGIRLDGVEARSLVTTTVADPLSATQRLPRVVESVQFRPLALADIIATIPVTGNAVEYVRDTSSTPGAAVEVAEGSAKPETTYTWELVTDTVKTIAHWMDITRQALEDEGQLRALAEQKLLFGLKYRIDGQIINGNGTSPNIRGILNTSGINTYNTGTGNDEARIFSLRKAKTTVRMDEYAANTAVLSPEDWQLIELSTDDNGAFRVTPNVQENLTPRIWGMTVIESTAIATGTSLIGDFQLGAALYDRMQPALYITDSDGDKFRSNIMTLLAEVRVGVAVFRPAAFCAITFQGDE